MRKFFPNNCANRLFCMGSKENIRPSSILSHKVGDWSNVRSSFKNTYYGGVNGARCSYSTNDWSKQLSARLSEIDPELYQIIQREKNRQSEGIELIPSENFTSQAVLDALGSVMQNKYSEGYPGKRYYGGNKHIDEAESLCQKRALEAFRLDENEWGVNVQPLSGSPANFYVYSALMNPHDKILSMELTHGGHLSHSANVSKVHRYFSVLPYHLDPSTGLINYDQMEELANLYKPQIIVAGTSAYSRLIDYDRFKKASMENNAYLMADMAHIAGLVAAGIIPSPFDYADVVTTTTHKSLRGPRGAMIFYRKGDRILTKGKKTVSVPYDLEQRINNSVFPGHQGGPHNHTITALAAALKLANTPEFVEYQKQVVRNCKAISDRFLEKGYDVVSGGTDNHLILVVLKNKNVDGARVECVLEAVDIALNKNTVPGDTSAMVPGGIRLGTPAMTSRGIQEDDSRVIADLVCEGVEIAAAIRQKMILVGTKKVADFKDYVTNNPDSDGMKELREKVHKFSRSFPSVPNN